METSSFSLVQRLVPCVLHQKGATWLVSLRSVVLQAAAEVDAKYHLCLEVDARYHLYLVSLQSVVLQAVVEQHVDARYHVVGQHVDARYHVVGQHVDARYHLC